MRRIQAARAGSATLGRPASRPAIPSAGGGDVHHAKPRDRPREPDGRVRKLGVGAAGDHVPDIHEPPVGSEAELALAEPEPDPAAFLEGGAEGAVVDDRVADPLNSPDCLQCPATNQHAAPGAGGGLRVGVVDAWEGKELLEEVDKGGDQEFFPRAPAVQSNHQGNEVELVGFGFSYQSPEVSRVVLHVGIGEQHEGSGRVIGRSSDDAGLHGPHLAHPPGRTFARALNAEARSVGVFAGEPLGQASRGILALVVDERHAQFTRVVLLQERSEAAHDAGLLVSRGDDDIHRGPAFARVTGFEGSFHPLVGAPESSMKKGQHDPDGQGDRGECNGGGFHGVSSLPVPGVPARQA